MDLGAQDHKKNRKSKWTWEIKRWTSKILYLDLRFRLGPSPPLNLKSTSKILKSTSQPPKSALTLDLSQVLQSVRCAKFNITICLKHLSSSYLNSLNMYHTASTG